MFYCTLCRAKHDWPRSIAVSLGNCEVCQQRGVLCFDVPSSALPARVPQAGDTWVDDPPTPVAEVLRDHGELMAQLRLILPTTTDVALARVVALLRATCRGCLNAPRGCHCTNDE